MITDSLYFLPQEQILVVTRKLRRFGSFLVLFEIWKRVGHQRFERQMRLGGLPYGSTIISHLPGRRQLLLGTSQGRFFVLDLAKFEVTHVISPPQMESTDLAYAAEMSPDGSSVAVFHEHRLIEYDVAPKPGASPQNVKGIVHQVSAGTYPTAHLRTGEYMVWGDSTGQLTFRQFRSRLPLIQIRIADLISAEELRATGDPIIDDISQNPQTGALEISVVGAKRVIRIQPPRSISQARAEVNPLFWQKGTRFDLRNVAEDVLLGRPMYSPEYNAVVAAYELRLKSREYAAQIERVKRELWIPYILEPTDAQAFRILDFAARTKTPITALLEFLRRRAMTMVALLDRSDVLGGILHILEVAEVRGAAPAAIFNQVEVEMHELLARLSEFKLRVPAEILRKVHRRLESVDDSFWYSLIKLEEMGLGGGRGFWTLISFLLDEIHPVHMRDLTVREILEAAHGALFFSSIYGNGGCEDAITWHGEMKNVMEMYSLSTGDGRIEHPTFKQAERLLRLEQVAGAARNEWFRDNTFVVQRATTYSFDHLLSFLEDRHLATLKAASGP